MADLNSELLSFIPEARHCILAELSAMLCSIGSFDDSGRFVLSHPVRREGVVKKCFTLTEKAFNMRFVDPERGILFGPDEEGKKAVSALCLRLSGEERSKLLLRNDCCRHSYLRGAFLCCGTLMDPSRGYRLEFAARDRGEAGAILFALSDFGRESAGEGADVRNTPGNDGTSDRRGSGAPGITERRGRYVVYIKNGGAIADILTAMGAYSSLMELENVRILREVRGDVNRRVNIEAANIEKTVRSSAKQTEDIRFIESAAGLDSLSGSLYETAKIRLAHPEESLSELGKLLDKPVSKSAMNHRMQRISVIAERLRKGGTGSGAGS
ncbi:MAG: DNA-binding protein WhiA [Lachnospiraceae bacterium]|nr:DNA-binding protein WhiA [Lachnospiraceae bacterium]